MTPERLGRYVIEAELGRGAMGVVYRAHDPRVDRRVALKTLKSAVPGSEPTRQAKDRFLNEGRAAGRLSHPGIVMLFDADEDPASGTAYLAMELVEGTDLAKLMTAGLPHDRLVDVVGQVASALDHAHARGVIHRDVKPANVLVEPDGRARLGDFGIARLGDSQVTQMGDVIGTPAYMSPEQVMGRTVTSACDVFSLGVVLYEGFTGKNPFRRTTVADTTAAIAHAEPAPPSALAAGLPRALDAVLLRALSKRPEDRQPTPGELASQVRAALEAPPEPATPAEPARPVDPALPASAPRSAGLDPRWLVVGVVALVIAVATILYATLAGRDAPAADAGGAAATTAAEPGDGSEPPAVTPGSSGATVQDEDETVDPLAGAEGATGATGATSQRRSPRRSVAPTEPPRAAPLPARQPPARRAPSAGPRTTEGP